MTWPAEYEWESGCGSSEFCLTFLMGVGLGNGLEAVDGETSGEKPTRSGQIAPKCNPLLHDRQAVVMSCHHWVDPIALAAGRTTANYVPDRSTRIESHSSPSVQSPLLPPG